MSTDSDMTIAGCGRCRVRPAEASGLCKTCETVLSLPADSEMVMVPREPTEAMIDAVITEGSIGGGSTFDEEDRRDIARDVWSAMLSASPVGEGAPVPVTIFCPICAVPHVDEGEWATTRHHKTHQCQSCGHEWRPLPFATVGVAPPAPSTTSTAEQVGASEASAQRIIDGLQDAVAGNFTVRSYSMPNPPGEGDAPVAEQAAKLDPLDAASRRLPPTPLR